MRRILSLIVLFTLQLAQFAHAYIPQSQSIAARLTRSHGKGAYVVEQELIFRTSTEPIILRERWQIENGEKMRVTVSTPQATKDTDQVRYEVLYHGGKRNVTELGAGIKTLPIGQEFFENFFHERTGQAFLRSLIYSQILPPSFIHEVPKPQKIEQVKHFIEPQVRLGRTAGVVSWIFGEASPIAGKLNPQVWIEQDSFVLRRLRFPTEAEVSADRLSVYPNGLRFPRERTVSWDNNTVTIRVVSIKAANVAQTEKFLDLNNFIKSARPGRLPDQAQIREFYTRFR